jgi:SAM-dependent methyltransferase
MNPRPGASSPAVGGPAADLHALAYPLNVYARVVELEEGQVQYLHYGLYAQPGMTMPEAQRRSTALLERLLPPPGPAERPCRVLEVGIGLGTTLARLQEAGYNITGITPDAGQIAVARARHGEGLPLVCTRLEDFTEGAGSWDVLLLQESAQYIDPLELFAQADRLLGERGEIVLADEFALRRTEAGRENLHLLEHFVAVAGRFGFSVAELRDVSVEAAPTVDYLLRTVTRHAAALEAEFGLDDTVLAALNASNLAYRERYASGRFGYALLRMQRERRPRWRVGRIDGTNAAEMRALFAAVFGHDMSAAHWQWKYGNGGGKAIGVWEGQDLVAHYGGVSRDIVYFGTPQRAAQSADVMVAPRGRGSLARRGPLFLAAATYLERALGFGNPHLLGFGFPSVQAWRAPELLGLYGGPVGRMLELAWQARRERPSLLTMLRPLDLTQSAHRNDADACWAALRDDLRGMIAGVRDAATLEHRFLRHPEKRYALYVVRRRFTGAALGVVVLGMQRDGRCELLDAIGALGTLPLLLHHARRGAAQMGATELFCWVTANIAAHFGNGAAVRDPGVNVPANIWTAAPPPELLKDKWWLTGGDTDFH